MIRVIFLIFLTFLVVQGFPPAPEIVVEDNFDAEWNDLDMVFVDGPMLEEQEKIQSTADIINKLKSLIDPQIVRPMPPYVEQINALILVLSYPEVQKVVDNVLKEYPELPVIIRGIRLFITGPEAKPLIDAFVKVIVPLVEAARKFWQEIQTPLENLGDVITQQSIRLMFHLQQPDVIAVFQKFRALPEVTKLAEYANRNGIDLMDLLQKLEKFMQSGSLIPTQ